MKDDGLIVLGVFGAVEERGWAACDGLFQKSQLRSIALQLGLVSRFEFGPFSGVVREPLTEFVAWCDIFEP